ncbi:MAG: glycine cleavage system aminomethyltransferase GcvT [Alphaproteobacteria bacterium]
MAGNADLQKTPLHPLHVSLGARMVPFAGYDMPVQYKLGVLKEHLHTRASAGLFDVSHMGQAVLEGPDFETVARALEALVPGDILALKPGRMRYTLLLNGEGGIVDDLMVTRDADESAGRLFLVVNAARKTVDLPLIESALPDGVSLRRLGSALLALQGPEAEAVLARFIPEAAEMAFMSARPSPMFGQEVLVSRSGYTGEDGFEISVPAEAAEEIARALLDSQRVEPIGLGARDSLRLEAGLCLYGHDIDETTTPVEAGLAFTIGKRRREEKDFPGAHRILPQLACGAGRKRVGLRPEGRAPAREGAEITDEGEKVIGRVTSGTFGPSAGGPVAMGYVPPEYAEPGTSVGVIIRGRRHEARVSEMPFVPHRYRRSAAKPVQTREAKSR